MKSFNQFILEAVGNVALTQEEVNLIKTCLYLEYEAKDKSNPVAAKIQKALPYMKEEGITTAAFTPDDFNMIKKVVKKHAQNPSGNDFTDIEGEFIEDHEDLAKALQKKITKVMTS